MFNIGDLVIYSTHGICHIDDICEKTYLDITRNYYVLHPLQDSKLTISSPVDYHKVTMLELIHREEAEKILEFFKQPGISWIELNSQRTQIYYETIKTGNRKEICKIVNTLMRKKQESEISGKKLNEPDNKLLGFVQNILFTELAVALDTTFEAIYERSNSLINENVY
ncbi:CarD family transcriptional regulator [Clostridium sp. CF012]|uniref:CarD family transcriptional regulator n=1 Tax=Clostridium sp. CF012 TaxID=2843319 RepID=UPI001C0AC91C|nr:CarD family transcriptional regulator [Clostridium sp. CF012]MBU3142385.1 CarD family transcriptional regulator [Clostridium sp. CF012]